MIFLRFLKISYKILLIFKDFLQDLNKILNDFL
jgi:hypothetical protein